MFKLSLNYFGRVAGFDGDVDGDIGGDTGGEGRVKTNKADKLKVMPCIIKTIGESPIMIDKLKTKNIDPTPIIFVRFFIAPCVLQSKIIGPNVA